MMKRANLTLFLSTLLLLLGSVLTALLSGDNVLRYYALAALLCSIGAIYVPALLCIGGEENKERFGSVPITLRQGLLSAAMGFALFLVSTALNTLFALLLEGLGVESYGSLLPTEGYQVLASLIVVCLIPAVAEEQLFRGLLINAYRPLGRRRAVWLTAALFALMHGQPASIPAILCIAYFMGAIAYDSRSMYPSMILHFVNNAAALLVSAGAAGAASQAAAAAYTLADYLPAIGMYLLMGLPLLWFCYRELKRSFGPEPGPGAPAGAAEPFGLLPFLGTLALLIALNILALL